MAENVKVNYIYADAEEKYVKNAVLYLGSVNGGNLNPDDETSGILYYDPEFTRGVTKEELKNLFTKGLIVVIPFDGSDTWAIPTGYTATDALPYGAVMIPGDPSYSCLTIEYLEVAGLN